MSETHHDNTKSTHCHDVGALSLEPSYCERMQRNYETYCNLTWPFCQSNCTPLNPVHRNDESHLFLPNHRRKRRRFAHVDLRAAMFSFPSCIAVDRSDRLFHDLSRNHAGHHRVHNYAQSQLRCGTDWKQAALSCQKQRFKQNVLNTSCHVHDKDGDITPVSYRTEKKIYSFLTMCIAVARQLQITNSRPFFSCCHIYLVRPGANFRWHHRIKRSC